MKFSMTVSKKWDGDNFKLTILPKVKYNTVREAALFCQAQAILLSPVDTGRLRGSIGVKFRGKAIIKNPESGLAEKDDFIKEEPDEGVAHVGTNVVYAAAQEFGLEKGYGKYKGPGFAPQPYLRPAADITEGKGITIIERGGKAEFEKYKGL